MRPPRRRVAREAIRLDGPGQAGPGPFRVRAVSLPEVHRSIAVPRGGPPWRRFLFFLGPGALVAVGYMDPGNWATDIAGGSAHGYTLLSVILISNLMAILLQVLAARLGIGGGMDLAQVCRARYSRPTAFTLWILCEIAIVACDLAEVIGTAIALQLLFGMPLIWGVAVTALDVLLILMLQSRGFRYLEAFILALISVAALCFVFQLVLAQPSFASIAAALVPTPEIVIDPGMLYIAIGIVGATVMPHNLYLHSAIVQTRRFARDDDGKRSAMRFAAFDTGISLAIAFLLNAAILILAAATFHVAGHRDVAGIEEAHRLITPLLGAPLAAVAFAVALLAAGQSSTITATLAGQVVMEGFLEVRLRPWLRRLITRGLAIVPAALVVGWSGNAGANELLVFSQVVLSLQLPFAVVPLIQATRDRRIMGAHANGRALTLAASLAASVIIALNLKLLFDTFF
jgi:manganese transport protein